VKRGKLKKSLVAVPVPVENIPTPVVKHTPPFSFKVTIREYTRLRVGDVVRFGEGHAEHIVTQINPSCARIIPLGALGTKAVSFTPRFADKPVVFNAPIKSDPIAISANSECPILRRLGKNWREKLNESQP
jgi:hypothetical protein